MEPQLSLQNSFIKKWSNDFLWIYISIYNLGLVLHYHSQSIRVKWLDYLYVNSLSRQSTKWLYLENILVHILIYLFVMFWFQWKTINKCHSSYGTIYRGFIDFKLKWDTNTHQIGLRFFSIIDVKCILLFLHASA